MQCLSSWLEHARAGERKLWPSAEPFQSTSSEAAEDLRTSVKGRNRMGCWCEFSHTMGEREISVNL